MRYKFIIIASIIALLLLIWVIATACGSKEKPPEAASTPAAESKNGTPSTPSGAAPGSSAGADTGSSETASPAESASTTSSASAQQATTATALTNLNLRGGPGINYPVAGKLPEKEVVTVVGRNKDSSWLVAQTDAGAVWLSADSDLVKVEGKSMAELPVVEAPVLLYNVNDPRVNLLLNQIPLVLHNPRSFTCVSHAGINNLDPLAEGNVIGPHAGDFVYNGDNVLFRYTNGSLRLIRENPVARFEGGVESLPFEKAVQLFQNGDIAWTGQLGQAPGRGVPGCDPAVP